MFETFSVAAHNEIVSCNAIYRNSDDASHFLVSDAFDLYDLHDEWIAGRLDLGRITFDDLETGETRWGDPLFLAFMHKTGRAVLFEGGYDYWTNAYSPEDALKQFMSIDGHSRWTLAHRLASFQGSAPRRRN